VIDDQGAREPIVVAVCEDDDPLAGALLRVVASRGAVTRRVAPAMLSDLGVCLEKESFLLDGWPVGGVIFRAGNEASLSEGFDPADRAFCDADISATWLAALHLDSVIAINRYDATAWYENSRWPLWRQRLLARGVRVVPMRFGDPEIGETAAWYPHTQLRAQLAPDREARRVFGAPLTTHQPAYRAMVACGEVLGTELSPAARATASATASVLDDYGVRLAAIALDADGAVVHVDTSPPATDTDAGAQAIDRLASLVHAHLRHW
jgi:hypothetical protein